MDFSKKFLPDPQQWVKYYEDIARGSSNMNSNRSSYRKNVQKGGSVGPTLPPSMNTTRSRIEKHIDEKEIVSPEIVSSAQQITDQAKSEIGRMTNNDNVYKRKRLVKRNSSTNKRRKVHNTKRKGKKKQE